MFYDNHGVALVHQPLKHVQQDLDVLAVKTRGRFVKNVEGVARAFPAELGGQFHPLAFSSRERYGGLPEADISETHVHQSLEFRGYGRDVLKEAAGLADWHFQNVVDVLAFVSDRKRVLFVPLSSALFADHVH